MIKVHFSCPVLGYQKPLYSKWPQFQHRVKLASYAYRADMEVINKEEQAIISSPLYSSDQVKDAINRATLARVDAHNRFESAIDDAHQELNVPYLVDAVAAVTMTGHAVFHNEAPRLPIYEDDVRRASISVDSKNPDLVHINYAYSSVMRRDEFLRWGLEDIFSGLNASTWEAICPPDYWLNCLTENNAAGRGFSCIHQSPYCRIYGESAGIFSLVSEDCHQAECHDEQEVNAQLQAWKVPLVGWE